MIRPNERRRHRRYPCVRPLKLRIDDGGRSVAAVLRDVSEGGALVEMVGDAARARPRLHAGRAVEIGIAWDQRTPLLEADHLIAAHIVRTEGQVGRHQIAIRFDQPQPIDERGILPRPEAADAAHAAEA